jgi:hypothetical protein
MIWLRRAAAILLAVVFIFVSVLVMVAFRVNSTAGNPDFYTEQLQQADVYHFIYDEVLPAALDDEVLPAALEESLVSEDADGADVIFTPLKPHLVDVVRQTVPPEWLQSQVEHVVNEVVPYVWGETDVFSVTIPLKGRVEAGAGALKNLLHREDVFPALYEQLIQLTAGEVTSEMPDMLIASEAEMKVMLRTVLPEDWLLAHLDSAIDEVVPYLTRETEHFTVRIDITRPLDELEDALIDILSKPEAYDSLLIDMLLPALQQNIGEVTEFPLGVVLTDDEIIAAARDMLTLEWYQEIVWDLVGQIFTYLRGEQDELEVVISLAEHKSDMAAALSRLADGKMESAFEDLPVCSGAHLLELLSDPSLENALCRPGDMSYQEFKDLVGINVDSLVLFLIEHGIPDEWVLTESEMNLLFGGEGEDNVLSQIRELVQEGMTFTEGDFIEIMDTDAATLEEMRQLVADGVVFTEHDLRDVISDAVEDNASEQMVVFEQVRSGLGMAKQWLNFIWIIPLLLMVGVGLLGGRRWSSKLIWAAALLAAMAIIAYIIFGPVFSTTAQPIIDRALLMEAGQAEGVTLLIAEKGSMMAHNAIDSFVSGLRNQSLGLIIASVVLIGGGVVWHNWDRIRRT